MPKVVKSSAREMILRVKEFCEAERKNQGVLIPLNNVRKRVAAITGVSEKTVTRITKEGITAANTSKKIVTPGKRRPHPKKFDESAIQQKIHSFYVVHKELPTLAKLQAALKEDINFQGSITTLHRILNRIGFKYKRSQSRCKIPINRNVEKRPIVYLDEVDEEMDRIVISTASHTETKFDSVSFHSSEIFTPSDHNYSKKL